MVGGWLDSSTDSAYSYLLFSLLIELQFCLQSATKCMTEGIGGICRRGGNEVHGKEGGTVGHVNVWAVMCKQQISIFAHNGNILFTFEYVCVLMCESMHLCNINI